MIKLKSSIGVLATIAILSAAISVGAQKSTVTAQSAGTFKSITRAEVELLLADVAESNPLLVQRFIDDPEMKKSQLDSLRELLAFASEAERAGLATTPTNKRELAHIRAEVVAVSYDRELAKGKPSMPPFAGIGNDRVAQYWATDSASREAGFQAFLDTKHQILKASNPGTKDRVFTAEEKDQAREFYAKVKIYELEYDNKAAAGTLPKTLRDRVGIQIKLQQAQFLARLYSEVMAAETTVSEREIESYISAHPELLSAVHRAKAEGILELAKSGDNFAKLANEFSDDPGNRDPDGKQNGGLYADVPKGRMIPAFEKAALELKPGQVSAKLVETPYGFHVIKLEKAPGIAPAAETYDVRHILISTMYKDPTDPIAQPVPIATYVETKLLKEKEARVKSEIVARNQVSVPDDFTIPAVKPPKTAAAKKVVPVKKRGTTTRRRTATRKG